MKATLQPIASPTRLQRLTNVTVSQLTRLGVDVAVEVRDDGKFALIMPPIWFHFFLASLTMQLDELRKRLTTAGWEAYAKSDELKTQLADAARRWEAQKVRLKQRYWTLMEEGLSSRDAIRTIKRESHGDLTATLVASIVERRKPPSQHRKRGRRRGHELVATGKGSGRTPSSDDPL